MIKFINFLIKTLLISVLGSQICYAGGIIVGRTRVIYDADKKEASLPLINNAEKTPS